MKSITISKYLLEILCCPKCKGDLILTEKEDGLICNKCNLLYHIKDRISVMLIDEAMPLQGKIPNICIDDNNYDVIKLS